MSKRFLEGLYDMASSTDDQGLSTFDQQKLRRSLDGNRKLMARNADTFAQGEPKFHTCRMYNPCPLCDKCLNKASHLYVKCQSCEIPICVHTYHDRAKMIRRTNFELKPSPELKEALRQAGAKVGR